MHRLISTTTTFALTTTVVAVVLISVITAQGCQSWCCKLCERNGIWLYSAERWAFSVMSSNIANADTNIHAHTCVHIYKYVKLYECVNAYIYLYLCFICPQVHVELHTGYIYLQLNVRGNSVSSRPNRYTCEPWVLNWA